MKDYKLKQRNLRASHTLGSMFSTFFLISKKKTCNWQTNLLRTGTTVHRGGVCLSLRSLSLSLYLSLYLSLSLSLSERERGRARVREKEKRFHVAIARSVCLWGVYVCVCVREKISFFEFSLVISLSQFQCITKWCSFWLRHFSYNVSCNVIRMVCSLALCLLSPSWTSLCVYNAY